MIDDHMTEWFGLPVEEYQPGAEYGKKIYRFGYSYEDESFTPSVLTDYLTDPRAASVEGIVLGMPGDSGEPFDEIIGILVEHAPKLPSLRGIFLGDILQEENEMSWIEQGDAGLIAAAFPHLEEFRIRGGSKLEFTPCQNSSLTRLTIETGGIPAKVLKNLALCSFPNLEHLELWLGTDEYGWDGSLEDVLPLLRPGLFPKLKSLGLRNSEIVNGIAEVIVDAPILDQLEALDLSGGTMTDAGAEFLLAGMKIRGLSRLNLFRNYLTAATIPRLQALGPQVDVGGQEDADEYEGELHYYVAVGE